MPLTASALLSIYSRNVRHYAFKRGWTTARLATELGASIHTVNRVLSGTGRTIDPEILVALLELFSCTPNDLFLPEEDIEYGLAA